MRSRATDGDHGNLFLHSGLAVLALLLVCLPVSKGQPPATTRATPPIPTMPATPAPETPLDLDGLVRLSLETNPRVKRAALEVEATRGRAVQAGLYPNPVAFVGGEELGSPQGRGGVITAPLISQEIVTAGKLTLAKEAALRAVDQAGLQAVAEQFVVVTAVRQGYFEVLTIQRRLEILTELVDLSSKSLETTKALLEAKQVADLDLIQFRVELNRIRSEQQATRRLLDAARKRLAATIGLPDLNPVVVGSLDVPDPVFDAEGSKRRLLGVNPQLRSAQVGISRAQLLLQRARAEATPNVTVGAGYQRHNKDRENDWTFQVSVPIPLWNRNQGNVAASFAEVGQAAEQIRQVENELLGRLAGAYGDYAAAKERVDLYRSSILKDADETYRLSLGAYRGGQFEYLRVLQAQRTVSETRLEYLRVLGEMWRAATDMAGLTLEDQWPPKPAPAAAIAPPKK